MLEQAELKIIKETMTEISIDLDNTEHLLADE
jgi:hypothetical protein